MRQATGTRKSHSEKIVKDNKRATRKHYSSEEKIWIVLDGLRAANIDDVKDLPSDHDHSTYHRPCGTTSTHHHVTARTHSSLEA